ncbi:cation diffusion facilitator family transporter [Georgenia satyanarayanai]|uniref:cation diffusion facilitator family transporter n=1 Tax=Georgenia satyanarayanai TaxID=860221 RepID=UPI00203C5FF5|nr:cation diffusion facilitator family transporter [Georgenia satyanarayanai]MCM3660319.1 cation diffusion facilitator family transporter [Georgenia satyanarayanai]
MAHDHHRTAAAAHRSRLLAAFLVTATVMLVEAVGGWLSGSLALLADAGHMLSDTAALGLALAATWIASRPARGRWTFGWQRVEILAALVNGVILLVVGVVVIVEGVGRFGAEPEIRTGLMVLVGTVGLVANLVSLWLLSGGREESLNVRGAYLEVLGDLLGSVAVLVAAAVIAVTGWTQADAVASVALGVFIVPRALLLLRDVARVLLEGAPEDMSLAELREHMCEVEGVVTVHDLHAWTITSGVPVVSAHVVVEDHVLHPERFCVVLDALQHCLEGHFDVEHSTLQLEPRDHKATEVRLHD